MSRFLAAAALAFALVASPALAATKHSRHHRHARVAQVTEVVTCDQRGCSDWGHRSAAPARSTRTARAKAAPVARVATWGGSWSLVAAARGSVGRTAADMGVRRSLWCMAALNKWLDQAGLKVSGSDMASSALGLGPRVQGPQVGAVAFMYRRGGGHAGVVSGVTDDGDPIIISGNHDNVVKEAVYPRSLIHAYVLPSAAGSG
jgi:uncharacterized protein (TIGR02594 family)